jgi:hypothetical protein
MAIQELEELFATFQKPEDRAVLEQLLESNQAARDYVTSGADLYKAFGEGDPAALTRVQAKAAEKVTPTTPAAKSAVSTPAFDMTQFETMVDQKAEAKARLIFEQLLGQDVFTSKVTGIVKKTADELAPSIYAISSRNANEIYDIKSAHKDEFGEPLDMTKFNEFLEGNKGKFASLPDSHNAFVAEKRIQNRIALGIREGIVAERSKHVPGGTLGSNTQPGPNMGMANAFVAANKLTKSESERGPAMDQAAAAFRQLQIKHAE